MSDEDRITYLKDGLRPDFQKLLIGTKLYTVGDLNEKLDWKWKPWTRGTTLPSSNTSQRQAVRSPLASILLQL